MIGLRKLTAAVAAMALLMVASGTARQAPAPSRVLVMPFAASAEAPSPDNAGVALWVGHAVALLLIDELAAQGLSAISREECVRAFDRLQLPMASTLTRATMIRVGELLGASEIVFGDVRVGTRLNVRAKVIRLDAGALQPDVTGEGTLEEIFTIAHRLGGSISTGLGRRGSPDAIAVPHPPLEVFQNYVKGLVAGTPAAQQRFFESALRQAPRDPRVLLALWPVHTAQGAHEKALGVASAVPKDSPLSRRARFDTVLSLISLGRLDGAFQELTALYSERPAAALSNALGVVQLRRAAGTSSPSAYFTRATQEDRGNTDYLFNLGYASALAGDTTASLLWLREAVRYDAADGDAHLIMSAVLARTGRSVEAQRELELARLLGVSGTGAPAAVTDKIPADLVRLRTDLDPSLSDKLVTNAGAPAQRDQRDAAMFQLDQGRRFFDAQNDRDATNALRRAVYLAPYEDEPHLLLGRIYQRGGRLSEAIDEFKVAIWCRETAGARVALGEALLESGDKEGARREADRALVLDRDSSAAKALLKKITGVVPSGLTHGRSGPA
jgi:Tfp pilus assembly protein PilF